MRSSIVLTLTKSTFLKFSVNHKSYALLSKTATFVPTVFTSSFVLKLSLLLEIKFASIFT